MLYAVIVRAPDDKIPTLEANAAAYARECGPDTTYDWRFASGDEVMFLFSSKRAANAFAVQCRLLYGFSCKLSFLAK
jgi:hypothetical protein